jgi:hypothetical protein
LKYSSFLPYAFTEHGALMAASVLNTPKAIDVSVFIIRAFVNVRKLLADNKEIQRKISDIEKKLTEHDDQIVELVKIIRQLINPKPPPKSRRIGFLK